MKIMEKLDGVNWEYFKKEANILKMLQHPNITAFKESYTDSKNFYIISELCKGGTLRERIMDSDWCMTENRASQLIRTMLLTIEYLHEKQIVHRDLKPDNFVFKTKDDDSEILLIDFGSAKIVEDNVRYSEAFGTPHFLAPEVVAGPKYRRTGSILKSSDVWSIGIIAYMLIIGKVPFSGDSTTNIFESILKKPLMFPDDGNHLSGSFLDFCQRMLTKSPHQRLTVKEALNHEWVQSRYVCDSYLPAEVLHKSSTKSDGALAMVHSLVSSSYVYRVEDGLYILGTVSDLEDICESLLV